MSKIYMRHSSMASVATTGILSIEEVEELPREVVARRRFQRLERLRLSIDAVARVRRTAVAREAHCRCQRGGSLNPSGLVTGKIVSWVWVHACLEDDRCVFC